jgi:pyroglutamyl-peptidase
MKLLLTAFDPFGGDKVNPALEAVKLVRDRIGDTEIVKLEVPTVFRKSIDTVAEAVERERPDAVLCVGQAGGRFDVTPERVAINVDDARIADNEGNQPAGPVYGDGPAAYFATLPVKAMARKIREAGLPSSVSNTAGTFVCNHLMYGLLYRLEKLREQEHCSGIRGGFIHVPFIPEQVLNRPAPAPSMALADIVRALEAAITAIGENAGDLEAREGREH